MEHHCDFFYVIGRFKECTTYMKVMNRPMQRNPSLKTGSPCVEWRTVNRCGILSPARSNSPAVDRTPFYPQRACVQAKGIQVSNMFGSTAAEGYKQVSLSIQKTFGKEFIQSDVCPQPGDAILDLGCGTGELSAYLAELVGPEGKVIGLDPDEQRIQTARKSHRNIKNLSFVEGSASNISEIFPESFDIIFSNYVLHWIPDKQAAFKNMFASLKPGGKIALVYVSYLAPFFTNALSKLNPENEARICKMYHCESREKIEQYCTSSGFEVSKSYQAPIKLVFENTNSFIKWLWSSIHGIFDPSLVTEERLQSYLALYKNKNGNCSLEFAVNAEEEPNCRLVAFKKTFSSFSQTAKTPLQC
ncbi:demethylmenaquinone methyltransferase-like [Montipora foliosa]|uniref:demethylmenaquinone methyltransferase-like n=1 Tax=Montipora foliosa TaxID=591990 RepID=UPI0035F1F859